MRGRSSCGLCYGTAVVFPEEIEKEKTKTCQVCRYFHRELSQESSNTKLQSNNLTAIVDIRT
jgi:hypothetical protein